jgi:hypothetical protein
VVAILVYALMGNSVGQTAQALSILFLQHFAIKITLLDFYLLEDFNYVLKFDGTGK